MKSNQRICNICGNIITYVSDWVAEHNSGRCMKCYNNEREEQKKYFTECPGCNEKIYFKYASARSRARKRGPGYCRSCRVIKPLADATGYSIRKWKENWSEWKKYKMSVIKITKKQNISSLENSDKRGVKSFHLDHNVSIAIGFMNKILPELIGDISNLKFIFYTENLQKSFKLLPEYEEQFRQMVEKSKNSIPT